MKKIMVIAAVLIISLLPVLLTAQDNEITLQKGSKTIIIKGDKDLADLDQLKKLNIDVNMNTPSEEAADAPFFGIYPADLDFPKAQALNYPNSYGVLITGIVPNSPAYNYRLAEDDIIMEMDGKKAFNLKEFDKLKALYRAGDSVILKIFRNGEIKEVNFVFGSKIQQKTSPNVEVPMPQKLSVGGGGGSWIPMFFTPDLDDVNLLITSLGFSELPDKGVLTHGFGGKGNVGKGWFLGGQFSFYNDTKSAHVADNYINNMSYDIFIGGATLDKRFAISKNVTTSLGMMLGGASHTVNLVHSNGLYTWPVGLSSTNDIMENNSSATFSKGYILIQPRAEVMVHILPWLGIRGEAGYMYGYGPTSGWKVKHESGDTYEISGSPDTPFQGVTASIGPWFGF